MIYKEARISTAKEEVEALLDKLPDGCSLEDIQYHLYVIEKVRHGLEAADARGPLTQEEAEGHLSKWLTEESGRREPSKMSKLLPSTISEDSTAYAAAVVKKILETARGLSRFPLAGRVVPEFGDENIRERLA